MHWRKSYRMISDGFRDLLCVRIKIYRLAQLRELLSNNSLSVNCKNIDHSRYAIVI